MIGNIVLDLPPKPGNPRNSEGAFIDIPGGLLFCYTGYAGDSYLDHATANICCIRCTDGGLTWSEPVTIVTAREHQAMNVMSVSMLPMQDGQLGLFYLARITFSDMRLWLRRSKDQGRTWSEAVCCVPRPGYFVINNDRAVRLSSGRILLPMAEHFATHHGGSEYASYSPAHATFFYSDDDGHTWRESHALVALSGIRSNAGLQEPGLLELNNGLLYGCPAPTWAASTSFFPSTRASTGPMPCPAPSPPPSPPCP